MHVSSRGSLIIVGSGIKAISHITIESKNAIINSDIVYYLVTDEFMGDWLRTLNKNTHSLIDHYIENKPRIETYNEIINTILKSVRSNLKVCVVFYGHPGVYVNPSHRVIQLLKAEGFKAEMYPGISAEDCLYCDLDFDPAIVGCQSYEATFFCYHKPPFNKYAGLILWQIGVIGTKDYNPSANIANDLDILRKRLVRIYGREHRVCIYEASRFISCDATAIWCSLSELMNVDISHISTLFVPPMLRRYP